MAIKEAVKKLNKKIRIRTEQHYKNNKRQCSYENWIARLTAYTIFKKQVWPQPKKQEVENFFVKVPGARKYWNKWRRNK